MPLKKNSIAIVGAGAVGAYYGCMLARAGHDVRFLVRSDFETVRERGYEVRLKDDTFKIHPAKVYQKPEAIGQVDLVIIALKTTANAQLPKLVGPLVGPHTLVLTLQNGMGNVELLAKHIPAVQILGGLCFVCINRVAPGVIENYLPGQVYIGEFMGSYRDRTVRLVELFEGAGITCYFSRSLDESLWRKLCWNIPFNGLSIAAGGVPTDRILASKELRELARLLMGEVQAAARAHGCKIPNAFLDEQFAVTRGMGAYKPSSMMDFQEGRAVEVEAIFGEPYRRGIQRGVPMPTLRALYLLLNGLCPTERKNG